MKKFLRLLLFVAIWAAISWRFRDRLLPLPNPDPGPMPHIRHQEHAPHQKPAPDAAASAPPPPAVASADDLTRVKGIGPVYRSRLAGIGVTTFAGLAVADAAGVAAQIGVAESMVEGWRAQAAALAG